MANSIKTKKKKLIIKNDEQKKTNKATNRPAHGPSFQETKVIEVYRAKSSKIERGIICLLSSHVGVCSIFFVS